MIWTAILKLETKASGDVEIALFADVQLAADDSISTATAGWSQKALANDVIPAAKVTALDGELAEWRDPTFGGRASLGAKLFWFLNDTKPGAAWVALLDRSKKAGHNVRTQFQIEWSDGAPIDLGEWPWELVRDDRNGRINRLLFADPAHPASRLVRLGRPIDTMPWPLKVLVLVGP